MSDDHALIVDDGTRIPMDPADYAVLKFDWSTKHFNSGVVIVSSVWTITAIRPSTSVGLTKDNESIIAASPYSSRWTQARLIGGGDTYLGHVFQVANKVTTDESPAQIKERSCRIVLEQM